MLDLIFQAILTDADILEELNLLIKKVEEYEFMEIMRIFLEFYKIRIFWKIKYKFEDHERGVAFIKKTEEIYQTIIRSRLQKSKESEALE